MPPTIAEIFEVVKSDSMEAINLVLRGCNVDHSFYDLIVDTRIAMYRKWQVRFVHINRDNVRADFFGKTCPYLRFQFLYMGSTTTLAR